MFGAAGGTLRFPAGIDKAVASAALRAIRMRGVPEEKAARRGGAIGVHRRQARGGLPEIGELTDAVDQRAAEFELRRQFHREDRRARLVLAEEEARRARRDAVHFGPHPDETTIAADQRRAIAQQEDQHVGAPESGFKPGFIRAAMGSAVDGFGGEGHIV
jgi:hypothetical protein